MRFPLVVKALPHTVHRKGLSPVCVRLWICKAEPELKFFLQTGQMCLLLTLQPLWGLETGETPATLHVYNLWLGFTIYLKKNQKENILAYLGRASKYLCMPFSDVRYRLVIIADAISWKSECEVKLIQSNPGKNSNLWIANDVIVTQPRPKSDITNRTFMFDMVQKCMFY